MVKKKLVKHTNLKSYILQSILLSSDSFKSQTRILGLVEKITRPLSPRLGESDVLLTAMED